MSLTACSVRQNVTYSSSLDVGSLGLPALLSLRVLVQNEDWRSRSHTFDYLNIRFKPELYLVVIFPNLH